MHSAHARIHLHTHACTATYTHMHIPMYLVVHAKRARRSPHTTRSASAGPCERGGGGTHSFFRLGQSTAAGSAASSVLYAYLRANRAAAPSGSGPPQKRAGRTRAPAMRAWARPRPTPGAAAAASNAARCGPAPGAAAPVAAARRPHRRERARRRCRGRGRTVPPRACTGRATRGAPSPSWRRWTCRAPRARAARARRATMGRRGHEPGRSHGKVATHARTRACACA